MCGYCGRLLVLQPEGDWACPPCRALMAEVVVGPPAAFPRQMAELYGRACRARARPTPTGQLRLF